MTAARAQRPQAITRIAFAGAFAAICGVMALTAWTIIDARRVAEEHAIQTTQNLVAALDHDIERNIEIYDLSLRNVIDGLQRPGIWSLAPDLRARVLFDGAAAAQDLGAIYVLDSDGHAILHSRAAAPKRASFADLEPFTIHRDHPDVGLYIGAPFRRPGTNGEWAMTFSRRVDRPDGSFGGVVIGTLRLAYFQRLFDSVDLGAHGTLALLRTDGPLVMRKPYDDSAVGQPLVNGVVFAHLQRSDAGHFETPGAFDGLKRIFIYRKLENLPLVLVAGTATSDVYAEWRQKAVFTGVTLAVLLAIAGLLALALRRELARAARADALLRDAVESMSEGFVIYDKDDRLVTCNEAYRTLYPKNAYLMLPGNRFEDIMRAGIDAGQSPDAVGHEEAWIAARMRDHEAPRAPHEHRLSSGRWVLTSERRLRDGGIAGLRVDITALKQIQASLRESQAMLVQAQRVSKTGSIFRDFATGKVEWSDEMYRIFGVTRDRFVPNTEAYLAMVHPEDRDMLIASIKASEQGVKPSPLQYRIIHPDGAVRWVYREAEILHDGNGKPSGRISTYKDITDQRTAELHAAELEVQLRHSQKLEALGNLAGGIAHDLNNTLVPILALSKLAMKRFPADSADYQDLDTIARAGMHARDLVKQVLAFSRKEPTIMHEIDLGAVVHDALKMLRASLPTTIRIVESIDAVPPIRADSSQLSQVIMNLVTNAAQAIGEKFGTVTVSVAPATETLAAGRGANGASAKTASVRLTITDTGCGIDAADLDRVFEPFFTTKEVGQGTGLGLAVVHGIVTGHGGRILCRSKRGEGSEFTVLLPVATGDAASPQMQPAA